MISVTEAQAIICASRRDFGVEKVLLTEAVGRVLAQAVFADRDFPPYDRITMDGIAIVYDAWQKGAREFPISGMAAAGQPLQTLANPAHCIEVATGAVLPENTDTIVPYEDCEIVNGVAAVTPTAIQPGQNIHQRGNDCLEGTLLISSNTRIAPAAIGVLATVGLAEVLVKKLPCVAICSTGDELVGVTATPAPHQIRRSNNYVLAAALKREGIDADLRHLPDDKKMLLDTLPELLARYDAVLFSGAVSKGAYDFLPVVLGELGMKIHFHRIAQKPGKPMLFGSFENGCTVFGFPGNPVSTLVCYTLYFRAWLAQSLQVELPERSAQLATDVPFSPALTLHLLVKLRMRKGVLEATPCAGSTSGDLVSLDAADGILSLPADSQKFAAGKAFPLSLLTDLG